jgi:hypothetical protein
LPRDVADLALAALKGEHQGELSPEELKVTNMLTTELQRFFEIAKTSDLLCPSAAKYISRDWGVR